MRGKSAVLVLFLVLCFLSLTALAQNQTTFTQGPFSGTDEGLAGLPAGSRINGLAGNASLTAVSFTGPDGVSGIAWRKSVDDTFKVLIQEGDSRLVGGLLSVPTCQMAVVPGVTVGEKFVYFSTIVKGSRTDLPPSQNYIGHGAWRFAPNTRTIDRVALAGDSVTLSSGVTGKLTFVSKVFPKPVDGREFIYLETTSTKGIFEVVRGSFNPVYIESSPWASRISPNIRIGLGVGFDTEGIFFVRITAGGFEMVCIHLGGGGSTIVVPVTPDGFSRLASESGVSILTSEFVSTKSNAYVTYAAPGNGWSNKAARWDGKDWSPFLDIYSLTARPASGVYILADFAVGDAAQVVGIQKTTAYSDLRGLPVLDESQELWANVNGTWARWFGRGEMVGGNPVGRIGGFTAFGDTILVWTKAAESYDSPFDHLYRFTIAPVLPAVKVAAVRVASSNSPSTSLAKRSFATVFGSGFYNGIDSQQLGPSAAFSLGGASATVCGIPARIFFHRDDQMNFLIPGDIPSGVSCDVVVAVKYPTGVSKTTAAQKLTIVETAPSPFMWQPTGASGKPIGQMIPVATDGMGRTIGPANAGPNLVQATPGGVVVFWGTGAGNPGHFPDELFKTPPEGVQMSPRPEVRLMTGETSSIPLAVLWAGEAGIYAGLLQLVVQLPDSIGAGTNWISIAGTWYALEVGPF